MLFTADSWKCINSRHQELPYNKGSSRNQMIRLYEFLTPALSRDSWMSQVFCSHLVQITTESAWLTKHPVYSYSLILHQFIIFDNEQSKLNLNFQMMSSTQSTATPTVSSTVIQYTIALFLLSAMEIRQLAWVSLWVRPHVSGSVILCSLESHCAI